MRSFLIEDPRSGIAWTIRVPDWLERAHGWLSAVSWRWRILVHFPISLAIETPGQWAGVHGLSVIMYGLLELVQKFFTTNTHDWEWHFLDWYPSWVAMGLVGAAFAVARSLA